MENKAIIPVLSHGAFTATRYGLIIDEQADVPYQVWEEYGNGLRKIEQSVAWIIGDWLNYGERKYGEQYTQAIEDSGFAYQTLANMKYVASRVPIERRNATLTWTHHSTVASLEAEEQEQWLLQAENDGLSVRDLRRAMGSNGNEQGMTELEQMYQKVNQLKEIMRKTQTALTREDYDLAWSLLEQGLLL